MIIIKSEKEFLNLQMQSESFVHVSMYTLDPREVYGGHVRFWNAWVLVYVWKVNVYEVIWKVEK